MARVRVGGAVVASIGNAVGVRVDAVDAGSCNLEVSPDPVARKSGVVDRELVDRPAQESSVLPGADLRRYVEPHRLRRTEVGRNDVDLLTVDVRPHHGFLSVVDGGQVDPLVEGHGIRRGVVVVGSTAVECELDGRVVLDVVVQPSRLPVVRRENRCATAGSQEAQVDPNLDRHLIHLEPQRVHLQVARRAIEKNGLAQTLGGARLLELDAAEVFAFVVVSRCVLRLSEVTLFEAVVDHRIIGQDFIFVAVASR